MLLAGVPVSTAAVVTLSAMLRDEYYVEAADVLDHAIEGDRAAVGLTARECNAILDVLDDPPVGLRDLQRVLRADYESRLRSRPAPA